MENAAEVVVDSVRNVKNAHFEPAKNARNV